MAMVHNANRLVGEAMQSANGIVVEVAHNASRLVVALSVRNAIRLGTAMAHNANRLVVEGMHNANRLVVAVEHNASRPEECKLVDAPDNKKLEHNENDLA